MRVLTFLLYAVLGYIAWRMIRVVARMMQGAGGKESGSVRTTTREKPTEHERIDPRVIRDAEFEDLTPPREREEGKNRASA